MPGARDQIARDHDHVRTPGVDVRHDVGQIASAEKRPGVQVAELRDREAVQAGRESFHGQRLLAKPEAAPRVLDEIHYKPGEVIFEKGQVGDSMYIIIEGKVRVYDADRTIARLGERDIFGELALLDPEPRFASISAETQTRLFRLDREAFLELMGANIEIVRGVLSVLCKRLRRSVKKRGPYQ